MPLSDEQKRENKLNKTFERYKALTIGKCKNDALKEFQKLRRIECAMPMVRLRAYHAARFATSQKWTAGITYRGPKP